MKFVNAVSSCTLKKEVIMTVDAVGSGCEDYKVEGGDQFPFVGRNRRELQAPSALLDPVVGEVQNALNTGLVTDRFLIDQHNSPAGKWGKEHLVYHNRRPHIGPSPLSSNPVDLVSDVAKAIEDAKSGDWVSAAADSLEVAKDVIDVAKEVGEALIDANTKGVRGDYAENASIGFQ